MSNNVIKHWVQSWSETNFWVVIVEHCDKLLKENLSNNKLCAISEMRHSPIASGPDLLLKSRYRNVKHSGRVESNCNIKVIIEISFAHASWIWPNIVAYKTSYLPGWVSWLKLRAETAPRIWRGSNIFVTCFEFGGRWEGLCWRVVQCYAVVRKLSYCSVPSSSESRYIHPGEVVPELIGIIPTKDDASCPNRSGWHVAIHVLGNFAWLDCSGYEAQICLDVFSSKSKDTISIEIWVMECAGRSRCSVHHLVKFLLLITKWQCVVIR